MKENNYNLILTSSGFNDANNYISDEMIDLFSYLSLEKRIMILANAAPEGSGNFIAREKVKENFEKVGASQVDIIDLNQENINEIFNYNLIYCLGGDPTYLINLNKNPLFKKSLIKFLENGIYIGESAGSIILSNNLKWVYDVKKGTKPKYNVELDTYRGLGLVEFNIFPHWNNISDNIKNKTFNYEKQHNIKIIKLNDGEFITVNYKK
jgi:peptidase E